MKYTGETLPCIFFAVLCIIFVMTQKRSQSVKNIPLAAPDITKKEIDAVLSVLKTPVLSLGPKLPEFEKNLAMYTKRKYAVAMNSGTSALHLIVRALGIGAGDEVITTPFSFIASSNCLLFENAKPVFVDIDPLSFNIDVSKIEEKITKKTKAILAVDVFGRMADWKKLQQIAKKHNIFLIEDSAEALGSEYFGKKAGKFGNASIFAFYPNKQITTGEGGAVLTDDRKIADLCFSMRSQGHDKNSSWLIHQRLGYNYRLSDINCALGIAQLKRIRSIIQKRKIVAGFYKKHLGKIRGITLPPLSIPHQKMNIFVYAILLDEKYTAHDRMRIMEGLKKNGIGCREYFPTIHLQGFYKQKFGYKMGDFPVAESISNRTIALPFFNNLKEAEVRKISTVLQSLLKTK